MNLLLGSSSPLGHGSGINTYVVELASALVEEGHQVAFACPTPVGENQLALHNPPICITEPRSNMIESARSLCEFIKNGQFDGIINNDNPVVQSILPTVACPAIAVGHMADYTIGPLVAHNHAWLDYVVAISNDMQRRFVLDYGIPVSKCPIVHNGVRGSRNPSLSTAPTLRVMYAGGHTRNKGADLMIDAVMNYPDRWKGIELHWFGEMKPEIASRLSGHNFVFLHGRVPRAKLLDCLQNCDIFLLPSRTEGCPMAMLEAMGEGLVPIASDGIGAMRWLINSGSEGFIVPLSVWADQLTESLVYLRDHPRTLVEMKCAVHRRFLAEFQISMTARKLIQLLGNPTVDRTRRRSQTADILRWHRPPNPSIAERLCWRLGKLRSAGRLTLSDKSSEGASS
jgi:glycosyltransferase involved in cell wall biosynthesis